MGRGAQLECTDEVAELLVDLLIGEPHDAQDATLLLGVVDADGAAAHLEAVHHQVVGIAAAGERIALDLIQVLLQHMGEGMVLGSVLLLVLVVAEHGEVHHPQKRVALAGHVQRIGHVQAQGGQHGVGDLGRIGREQQQVARLHLHLGLQGRPLLVGEELLDGALLLAVGGERHPGHALGAVGLGDGGHLLHLAAAPVARALGVDGLHHAARLGHRREHLEAGVLHNVGNIVQEHAEAHVGTVTAIEAHGVGVLHLLQGEGHIGHAHGRKRLGHDRFHHVAHIVALHEGHLNVHLGELRLAVGAQILVAEAAGNLVVALYAGAHEHLLELLGALGQGVELARVRTARHNVVASALGGGVRQDRRLNLQESALVEGPAHGLGHRVAQLQVGEHLRTANVQVAPFHAGDLVGLDAVFDGKRRCHRSVQHLHGAGQHFDLAGNHVRVHSLRRPLAHAAGHLQHVLAAQVLGCMEVLLAHAIRIDDHLRIALAVAQVDEDEPAVVAGMPRPTGQRHLLVHVGRTQLSAGGGVHAIFVAEVFHSYVGSPRVKKSRARNRIANPPPTLAFPHVLRRGRSMHIAYCPRASQHPAPPSSALVISNPIGYNSRCHIADLSLTLHGSEGVAS